MSFHRKQMRGTAVNATPVLIKGTIILTVQFAEMTVQHTFLVVDGLSHDCILGRDFVNDYQIDISLWKGKLQINRSNQAEQNSDADDEEGDEEFDICCINKIRIPANSQLLVKCYAANTRSNVKQVSVEADDLFTGKFGLYTLESISNKENLCVRIVNTQSHPVMVRKGTKIAHGKNITDV